MNIKELLEKYEIGYPACGADCGDGWVPLLEQLIQDLLVLGWDKDCQQVKEKFGTLRFYIGVGSDEIYKVISAAEGASAKICEECGNSNAKCKGLTPTGGWIITLCDPCRVKHNKKKTT